MLLTSQPIIKPVTMILSMAAGLSGGRRRGIQFFNNHQKDFLLASFLFPSTVKIENLTGN